MLAERGFRVVRFDNRDIGHSTKIESAGMPSRVDMLLGRRATAPYLLRDMADDTIGLMDHLGIDVRARGRRLDGRDDRPDDGDRRPERVRSMVSIMSTTGNRWLGLPQLEGLRHALGRSAEGPRGRDRAGRQDLQRDRLARLPLRRGALPRDRRPLLRPLPQPRRRRCASCTRSPPPATAPRRCAARACRRRSSTAAATRSIRPAGGRATAAAIPGARLRMIEGMGHDLPRELWPDFVEEIAANAERAEPQPGEASRPERGPVAGRSAMRLKGVEPSRAFAHTDLNRARLPVPPQPREQAIYRLAHRPPPPREATHPPLARIAILAAIV